MTDATPPAGAAPGAPVPAAPSGMTGVPPAGEGPEVLAWPAPSGMPAVPPAVEQVPVLPVPYGPPEPVPVADQAHWQAAGEPPLIAAAHVAVHQQRFADAVRLIEEFLREHPADVRAWHRLAGARIGLGDHAAALADAERSVELDPACAPAHQMRGLALNFLDRPVETEQAAIRSIELAPGNADGHALLAEALRRQGRTEAALAAARAALAIAPGHPGALRVIAGTASPAARWMAPVAAVAFPVAVVLGVLALILAGSPAAPVFGGFAVAACLPLFAAILRWAVGSRGAVTRPLPNRAFLTLPLAATAFVAAPLLVTGTGWRGAVCVLLLTVFFATACAVGVQRRLLIHR
ncbi:tetratricopeptide repeat protein [Actinoplanes oblitus]|uniref:Tetratricopeptide repeat protein n=1 Tax=Actinoplanes oblitus TaxID=3040509 RepID=A0ABY8WGC0_9ACTN|nr:tetratricopeptide repeat protein [Actinoplanes oblitus]WIM95548.1 tetratricopeptide repeat protein [Actinoplanes oblitus]